jgi:hypothetical protein
MPDSPSLEGEVSPDVRMLWSVKVGEDVLKVEAVASDSDGC